MGQRREDNSSSEVLYKVSLHPSSMA